MRTAHARKPDGVSENPAASNHRCPIRDCGASNLPRGILMCRVHWRRVPKGLQEELWAAWRAYGRGDSGSRARYLSARNAAIRSVENDPQERVTCGNCGAAWPLETALRFRACPHCGALRRGER